MLFFFSSLSHNNTEPLEVTSNVRSIANNPPYFLCSGKCCQADGAGAWSDWLWQPGTEGERVCEGGLPTETVQERVPATHILLGKNSSQTRMTTSIKIESHDIKWKHSRNFHLFCVRRGIIE